MKKLTFPLLAFTLVFVLSSCEHIKDYIDDPEPSRPEVRDFATGLSTPLGVDMDKYHRLWVAEAGTGTTDDGQVSLITPNGEVHTVIEGFPSDVDPEGNAGGLNHLLYDNGTLWVLHGLLGRLYMADVSDFVPGDAPLQASELQFQEVGSFVTGAGFEESNLYKMTKGPDGDLFMVDAGANSIIRRDAQTAELSFFAEFPPIANPTPVGPPSIDAVPTGIVYDGNRFLVSSLTGFPFPEGKASVYAVDQSGNLSVYQDGLTALVDIELDVHKAPHVLQFSEFGPTGWMPGTGKIIRATDEQTKVVHTGLSFASDMELAGAKTAYVTNIAEGKIVRVRY